MSRSCLDIGCANLLGSLVGGLLIPLGGPETNGLGLLLGGNPGNGLGLIGLGNGLGLPGNGLGKGLGLPLPSYTILPLWALIGFFYSLFIS